MHTKFEETRYYSLWKIPKIKVSDKRQCTSVISLWTKNSLAKPLCVTYVWCTLYIDQDSFRWDARFLRYRKNLFCTKCASYLPFTKMTSLNVDMEEIIFRVVYHDTKFKLDRSQSFWDMKTVMLHTFYEVVTLNKGQGQRRWRLYIAFICDYSLTKFEETGHLSLWQKRIDKFFHTFTKQTNYLLLN